MRTCYILLLCFLACNIRRTDCITTAGDVLKNNRGKVHVGFIEKKKIVFLVDNASKKNNGRGGAYWFYPGGRLKSYRYFQADSAYSYEETYDKNGKLIKTTGSPLVDDLIREVNKDSTIVSYYLFSLHKTYRGIKVFTSNNLKADLDLKDDTACSNIKIASFSMNTKGLKEFKIYFSCNCFNECTSQSQMEKDTLSFVKNPGQSLVDKY